MLGQVLLLRQEDMAHVAQAAADRYVCILWPSFRTSRVQMQLLSYFVFFCVLRALHGSITVHIQGPPGYMLQNFARVVQLGTVQL